MLYKFLVGSFCLLLCQCASSEKLTCVFDCQANASQIDTVLPRCDISPAMWHYSAGIEKKICLKHAYAIYRGEKGYYMVDTFFGHPKFSKKITKRGIFRPFVEQ